MLELIRANKTEHPRLAVGVCVKDWEPRIRVASPDESGKLVAQGAHRVHVPDVDGVYIAISLRRGRGAPWSGISEKGVEKFRTYDIADCESTPQVLVLCIQIRELGKPIFFMIT